MDSMKPTPSTRAFLEAQGLNLRAQRVGIDDEYWQITDSREYFIVDFIWYGKNISPTPGTQMVKFFVNSTPSSQKFPQRGPARRLFNKTDALRWLDELIQVLHEDLGDYTCAIKTGATDAPYFEKRGYVRLHPDRHTMIRRIDGNADANTQRVAYPTLPETTIALLDSIGMQYVPEEDLFVTYNKTGRRRTTRCHIDWDSRQLTTTFNTSDAPRDYPRFLKDHRTREEHLTLLEDVVKSIAAVHGPFRLCLRSGHTDAGFLALRDYTWTVVVGPLWVKTFEA